MRIYVESLHSRSVASLDPPSTRELMDSPLLAHSRKANTDSRTMILMREIQSPAYKGPREGAWYDLPDSFWQNCSVESYDENSLLYRLLVKAPGQPFDFARHRIRRKDLPRAHQVLSFDSAQDPLPPSRPISLNVYDVGHGNWNDLVLDDESRVAYDFGASRRWHQSEVRSLVNRIRSNGGFRNLRTAFISHWDADHYHAILQMTHVELNSIQSLVGPGPVPGTGTLARVISHLAQHGVPLFSIPPAKKARGSGRSILLRRVHAGSSLSVFRATPGVSKNQTGIVLLADGTNKQAILPADHHYPKILAIICPPTKPHVLVVPHHGGRAGMIDGNAWLRAIPKLEGIISWGPNQWGHPLKGVYSALSAICVNVLETNGNGDVCLSL